MKIDLYLSKSVKTALQNDPPGEWMPFIPENCIRLSSGYPDSNYMPVEEIKEAFTRLLDEEQDLPLHYLGSPRITTLERQIQERLKIRGMKATSGEILITSGACQAIDLIARILIDEETVVAVESPTYMEALEIFQNYTKNFITIPVDENGIQTDILRGILSERKTKGLTLPRVLYTIPSFQNPTGTTMTLERRQHILELASEFDFLILEDDAYGELSFNDQPIPLKAMDQHERVLHVGSLSKIVAPGMRIGWIHGAAKFITALAWFKKDLDHPFSQATMSSFLEKVDFEDRLRTLREMYQTKCKVLLSAMEEYLPETVSWFVPEGGYFVWVKISGLDTSDLLTQALEEGVSFIPGKYFFINQLDGKEYLRLSFSYASEKQIVEGIRRLSKVIHSAL